MRAQGPNLSVGAPDGYMVGYDCGDRPFAIARGDKVSDGGGVAFENCDGILYSVAVRPDGNEGLIKATLPELKRAMRRGVLCQDILKVDREWLLQGENCECLAFRLRQGPDTFSYHICPINPQNDDFLCVTFYDE